MSKKMSKKMSNECLNVIFRHLVNDLYNID